ncbi:MAG: proton-conducting transporter transmembrane domain-containing protein [Flavisolibacter sp.]
MSQLLQFFILLPLAGFFVALFIPRLKEKLLSGLSIGVIGLQLAGITAFFIYWLLQGHPLLDIKHFVFYQSGNMEIFIDFYFDKVTAVFAIIGAMISLLVVIFSRFYLHRDKGYKRFFLVTLLFFASYNIVIFSGNFETLFLGWEILGICSLILIAFYRDRYLPVKNGLKVISVYRLGDICLILAMWMSHHLWHSNIRFEQMNDASLMQQHLSSSGGFALFLFICILVAAAVKSAQLPFSTWLPRAMEGPTTSSGLFYGSLSVHLGVFLLMRTYPYWEQLPVAKLMVVALGLATSVIAAGIARMQSTVKTQIAYSSITQIGIIFIEVALGFHVLALIHFAGNSFLRTYQLLVSPSVLSYLTHDMVFHFRPAKVSAASPFMRKISNSLYILSLKEWNLDGFQQRFLWGPFKKIGVLLPRKGLVLFLLPFFLLGLYTLFIENNNWLGQLLPVAYSIMALLLILSSFAERDNAKRSWLAIVSGQLFLTLAIALAYETFTYQLMLLYLSGIVFFMIVGFVCLHIIEKKENDVNLDKFHGHAYEHPGLSVVFLLSCLGVAGLPFTPTFIGMDILFSQIGKHDLVLTITTALSFLFVELCVLRIYARIFMGPHKKPYHPIAYRSS